MYVTFFALLLYGLDGLAVGGVALLERQLARPEVSLGVALAPRAAHVSARLCNNNLAFSY